MNEGGSGLSSRSVSPCLPPPPVPVTHPISAKMCNRKAQPNIRLKCKIFYKRNAQDALHCIGHCSCAHISFDACNKVKIFDIRMATKRLFVSHANWIKSVRPAGCAFKSKCNSKIFWNFFSITFIIIIIKTKCNSIQLWLVRWWPAAAASDRS